MRVPDYIENGLNLELPQDTPVHLKNECLVGHPSRDPGGLNEDGDIGPPRRVRPVIRNGGRVAARGSWTARRRPPPDILSLVRP